MDPLQVIGSIVATQAQTDYARSALPDAPVVPVTPARRGPVRAATARLLRGLADALAPSEPTVVGRPTLSAGEGSARIRWDESRCRPSPTTSG